MGIRDNKKWIIIISFTTAFLDMVKQALLVPIIPFLCAEMDATAEQRSLTFSIFSITQMISLLIMGPVSDRYGRRPFLILSLIGSSLGSLFQAMAPDITSFILWRGVSGLFAGSLIIVQAVVADLIPSGERNLYLARLDGCMNAAYIVGPALGGILGSVNNRFPLFVCAIVSALALVVAWIALGESHPNIIAAKQKTNLSLDLPAEEKKKKKKKEKKEKVKITPMMISLLVFEFCVRWMINAFDSTYGSYLMEDYGITESTYSTYFVIQSIAITVEQFTIYPYLSSTLNIPIPYLSCVGQFLQVIFYILTGWIKNPYGSMAVSILLFMSYCLSTPGPISIISTTNKREVQGTVIAWLNICNQSAMIVSPLVAAEIYKKTKPGVLYYSSIFSVVAFFIMLFIALRPDAKKLGKVDTTGEDEDEDTAKKEVKSEVVEMTVDNTTSPAKAEEQVEMTTETSVNDDASPAKAEEQVEMTTENASEKAE